LIPLFAVGVFLAYTLSQTGMLNHWWRERGRGWKAKAVLNGTGALATGVTFVIVGANKFFEGAWVAILLVPILVILFLRVHARHKQTDPGAPSHDLPVPHDLLSSRASREREMARQL
jgi:peptidoglycan/LPS O-acetylase OafA/YrhL